ncbi:DUF6113 family protein [Streptomyces sp. N2-109]|uniref:DUF6113 family protein n=1 Tax=Streptomyces gossypii TaxID=2883101 RepID=A0ABT2JW81_9ACTN|nr:DUF6113 family protein [Streptomyces gossypii]MCT2591933.1 DUF6113 family protein [Streptomyces gossypii]
MSGLLGGLLTGPVHRPVTGARIAAYAGLVVLGLLIGAAGALVQAGWSVGGVPLALAGAAGLFWGGAQLTRTKLGAIAPAGGWVVAVVLLTMPRPEGDFVFGTGLGSYVFLFGGMLLAVICATIALPAVPLPADKRTDKSR